MRTHLKSIPDTCQASILNQFSSQNNLIYPTSFLHHHHLLITFKLTVVLIKMFSCPQCVDKSKTNIYRFPNPKLELLLFKLWLKKLDSSDLNKLDDKKKHNEIYKCPKCLDICSSVNRLKAHLCLKKIDSDLNKLDDKKKRNSLYKCSKCLYICTSDNGLRAHLLAHAERKVCEICLKLNPHRSKHQTICNYCLETVQVKQNLTDEKS